MALGAGLWGCGTQGVDGNVDPQGSSPEVGHTEQRGQFADGMVTNLVDFASNPTILITSDFNPVGVNIYYVSDKTTDSGHQVGSTDLVESIAFGPDETKTHTVNLAHPAFAGGYGALFLDANGFGPFDVFQTTMVSSGGGYQDFGGSVFTGGSYRIPYLGNTAKMVIAFTNQSDYAFDVQIAQLGSVHFKSINLTPFTTYKFDSSAYGWVLGTGPGSIQIFTTAGGVLTVTGYALKGSTKYRLAPAKAAPYF